MNQLVAHPMSQQPYPQFSCIGFSSLSVRQHPGLWPCFFGEINEGHHGSLWSLNGGCCWVCLAPTSEQVSWRSKSVHVRGVCPLQSIPGSAGGFVDKKALILLCIKFFASSVPESVLSRLETFHSPSQQKPDAGMASSSFHIASVLGASSGPLGCC